MSLLQETNRLHIFIITLQSTKLIIKTIFFTRHSYRKFGPNVSLPRMEWKLGKVMEVTYPFYLEPRRGANTRFTFSLKWKLKDNLTILDFTYPKNSGLMNCRREILVSHSFEYNSLEIQSIREYVFRNEC